MVNQLHTLKHKYISLWNLQNLNLMLMTLSAPGKTRRGKLFTTFIRRVSRVFGFDELILFLKKRSFEEWKLAFWFLVDVIYSCVLIPVSYLVICFQFLCFHIPYFVAVQEEGDVVPWRVGSIVRLKELYPALFPMRAWSDYVVRIFNRCRGWGTEAT